MLKVVLVSNWNDTCGIAEYGRNLTQHSDTTQVSFKVIIPPFTKDRIKEGGKDCDVIHFNYSSRLFTEMYMGDFVNLRKEMSQPWVVTIHESSSENVKIVAELNLFDKVVTHERYFQYPRAARIPMPYAPVDLENPLDGIDLEYLQPKIGFAGFPFPWKGFYAGAKAARANDLSYLAIIPNSHHVKAGIAEKFIKEANHDSECITSWLPYEQVVQKLSRCWMNVFPYGMPYEDKYRMHYPVLSQITERPGISGAVRMGIAAKRPIIITNDQQFSDLYEDYPDEVYVSPRTQERLNQMVTQVLIDIEKGQEKRPKRMLEDMSWNKAAESYLNIYKEVGKKAA